MKRSQLRDCGGRGRGKRRLDERLSGAAEVIVVRKLNSSSNTLRELIIFVFAKL